MNIIAIELETTGSNEIYNYFDELLGMLKNEKSFVRVRAFRLICTLAKWDIENKTEDNIDLILNELDDDTSTSVRQCLDKLILYYYINLNYQIKLKRN